MAAPTPSEAARAQARREAIRVIPSGQNVAGTGPKIGTPAGAAPIIPLLLIFTGGYLAWFGVHYFKKTRPGGAMLWPSDPVKAVLTGKPVATAAETVTVSDQATLTAAFSPGSAGPSSTGTGPQVTGTYGNAQLEQLWTANGGSAAQAPNAAAHAMQESSGNKDATSANPDGGTNVGLWQLDTKGVGAGYTVAQLKDPNLNARLTVMATVNGTNWSQWATPGLTGRTQLA